MNPVEFIMHAARPIFSFVLAASILAATACRKAPAPASVEFPLMGVAVSIELPASDRERLPAVAFQTRNALMEMDALFSLYKPDSELSLANRIAPTTRLPLSEHAYRLLEYAQRYSEQTFGAFDVTVGPVASLWGFLGADVPLEAPSPALLKAALESVGYRRVLLADRAVEFSSPFTQIDLGGIALGYATDIALIQLRRIGENNLLLRVGQSARALGERRPGQPWTLPLSAGPGTELLGEVLLRDGWAAGVARRGELTVEIDGLSYSHIIDPRTGRPADRLELAMVVGPTATDCDALSTALLVATEEEASAIMARYPRCEAMLVDRKIPPSAWATDGFKALFKPSPALQSNIAPLTRSPAPSAAGR